MRSWLTWTVVVEADAIERCLGPDAAEHLRDLAVDYEADWPKKEGSGVAPRVTRLSLELWEKTCKLLVWAVHRPPSQ